MLKHKSSNFGMGAVLLLVSLFFMTPVALAVNTAPTASGGTTTTCTDGTTVTLPATCPTTTPAPTAATSKACSDGTPLPADGNCYTGSPHCGGGSQAVKTSISIGCSGKGNPILDAVFAIIRFLSDGVGLVIVASTIYAGIQYSSSRGDPNASAQAMKRIQSNVVALLIFIFAYAILNYILPANVLQ
jgi:hypothetical protein